MSNKFGINRSIKFIAIIIGAVAILTLFFGYVYIKKLDNMYIYLYNYNTSTIEKVPYEYEDNSSIEEMVIQGLNLLKNWDGDPKYKSTISDNVQINNVNNLSNGVVEVDLSSEFYDMNTIEETISLTSIVYTLTEIEDINKVDLYIDGEKYIDAYGNEHLYFSKNDMSVNMELSPKKVVDKDVTLYFPSIDKEGYVVKENRTIETNDDIPLEKYIVEQIIIGSEDTRLYNPISKDVKLREVITDEYTCQIDLSSQFITQNYNKSKEEQEAIIYSIVNSLTELSYIRQVQILIDSKKSDGFKYVDLSKPIERDESFILEYE